MQPGVNFSFPTSGMDLRWRAELRSLSPVRTPGIDRIDIITVPVITVAVSPASVAEDGAGNLLYTFTRTGVTSGALTVNFAVGGTATAGSDYVATGAAGFGASSGTVSFGPGSSTAEVTLNPQQTRLSRATRRPA